MATHDIYIYQDGESSTSGIRIPWLPSEISFDLGGMRAATYEIMDVGDVDIPNGSNLEIIKFSSVFPGEGRSNLPFLRGSYIPPKSYQEKLTTWMKNGTKLKIIITGTPINHNVYCESFVATYSGAYGDINYNVSFKKRRDITIKTIQKTAQAKKAKPAATKSSSSKKQKTHKVKRGDTLWALARKYLGKGSRYKEIYKLNKSVIEKTAKKHGRKSSSGGHWIYPGTVLKIPKK